MLKNSNGLGEEHFAHLYLYTFPDQQSGQGDFGRKRLLGYNQCNRDPQLSVHVKSRLHIHYLLMSAVWSRKMYFPLWCISQFDQPSVISHALYQCGYNLVHLLYGKILPPDYCGFNCKQNIWEGREPGRGACWGQIYNC